MRRRLLSLLLLLILLCGCGKKEAVSEDPQPETPEAAAPQPEKGEPETVVEGQQIIYLEPQYVYLEDEQEESDDLVFSGWNTETEDNEMAAARYQDISDVTNAVAIPAVYGSHGEIVTTPLRVGGMVELCAFDLRISYDNNRLKYVGCDNVNEDLLVNADEESGTLLLNFLRIINLSDGFEFCDLQFEVLTEQTCESMLHIEVVEAVSLDESGDIDFCNFSTVDGVVYLNQERG